jgi:hypothetical protein
MSRRAALARSGGKETSEIRIEIGERGDLDRRARRPGGDRLERWAGRCSTSLI